ncbi:MAG: hypothetical protein A4S12_11985 [Proteobacteria bacterium SG_bin5]|nr:hypothetical protein [Sphingomonas sp.]OQW38919.1 MAG: hypothetical protein A4S12_11985 [Proteobacteria bacterium SG_bin5]
MQFLKTLLWFLLAVVVALFIYGNWTTVRLNLWADLVADVNLPLLLIATFLAGLMPMLLWHHAVRWRMRQRLNSAERAIADLRGAMLPAAEPPAPPAAIPSAVPPGGA